jgi:glycine/D-amino acid oxidase-like deaminating enzyme
MFDAVIIGGGFFGASIAEYLRTQRQFERVVVLEREESLLQRASYHNQARIHNGYHYPRSFTTAYRSRVNLPRFVQDFPSVVSKEFNKIYAIGSRNSKVSARQFVRFCQEIGAALEPAPPSIAGLFNPRLVEGVYVVQEFAFDAAELRRLMRETLAACQVPVRTGTTATAITQSGEDRYRVTTKDTHGHTEQLDTAYVFNCTYSGINQLMGDFPGTKTRLKHEITEMPLLQVPDALRGYGITMMDGPFFSMMPFPARGLHTLSHVRYTPHLYWQDESGLNPYDKLDAYHKETRAEWMIKDVARYLPAIADAIQVDSLFEVKTILMKSEADDGRPILFEHPLPHCYTVLGGKIDNIYDILARLEQEDLSLKPIPA